MNLRWTRAQSFCGYHTVAGPFILHLYRPQPADASAWLLKVYLEGSLFRCRLWAFGCVDHRAAHRLARMLANEPHLFTCGDDVYQQHRLALQQLFSKGGKR
jgi:hypothetical protein